MALPQPQAAKNHAAKNEALGTWHLSTRNNYDTHLFFCH